MCSTQGQERRAMDQKAVLLDDVVTLPSLNPKLVSEVLSFACLVFAAVSTLAFWGQLSWKQQDKKKPLNDNMRHKSRTRCIVDRMREDDKRCVIFFGSQTGNAHVFAEKLAKEGRSRFNLSTMVADLEAYDYEGLVNFPNNKLAIFLLSSYGQGEPTDNAARFFEFITAEAPVFSEYGASPLKSMRYATFGLGNSTYEHFNAVVRKVDSALQRFGATPIVERGEGDDGKGSLEDDFMAWKDTMWASLKNAMDLHEQEHHFEPAFTVIEKPASEDAIFLGERSEDELKGITSAEPGPQNPFVARILASKELFASPDRHCLHMELDIRNSGLSYETGDHVAIWPSNSDVEVERFLRVFGLLEKRHQTVHISALDANKQLPFPTPTTYDAAVRYYMDICGPVSRQFLGTLATFMPVKHQKATVVKLSKDKDYFREKVTKNLFNLAQLVESLSPKGSISSIPFKVLIEGLRALQPRWYSISSSSLIQKDVISLTVSVESVETSQTCFKGVASNYLFAIKRMQHGDQESVHDSRYAVTGPRNKYSFRVPIHVRRSSFKLPQDISRPIVMIGPGTGVAPFRAFVQERIKQMELGKTVGNMILFFGCRKEDEDFIYRDDWKEFERDYDDKFRIYTAFSRESAEKVYVQHRLVEHSSELRSLLLDQTGYIYVCGSSQMARDVQYALSGLLNGTSSDGGDAIHQMKACERYQEDVW